MLDHYLLSETVSVDGTADTACGVRVNVFPVPPYGTARCATCAALVTSGAVA